VEGLCSGLPHTPLLIYPPLLRLASVLHFLTPLKKMGEASGLDKEAGARTTEAWNTTRAGHAAP